MRKLFLILIVLIVSQAMAQSKYPFTEKWEEIEQKETQGLLKSVLPQVEEIFAQAKKENNAQQKIKALLYKSKIAVFTADDDDTQHKVMQDFYKEMESAPALEKSVLQSIIAETLLNYYTRNSWTINQRTNTEEATTNDFRFWTEDIFVDKISELYLNSIKEKNALQNENIDKWTLLLDEQKEHRELRPTLYDFLAHRALNYFGNRQNYFYGYVENGETKKDFNRFKTSILTDLVSFHREKGNRNAQGYNELLLLEDTRNNFSQEEYLEALNKLTESFSNDWIKGDIQFRYANELYKQSNKEQIDNYARRKELLDEALKISEEISTQFPERESGIHAEELKEKIKEKDFSIEVQEYVSPNLKNPLKITHKNVDKIYFKIYKYSGSKSNLLNSSLDQFHRWTDAEKQKFFNSTPKNYTLEKEFQVELKSFDDYQNHSTWVKLDELKSGHYLILAGNDKDWKVTDEDFIISYKYLDVTPYSLVNQRDEVLVTDRETGNPIQGLAVGLYESKNKSFNLIQTKTTDKDGIAKFPPLPDRYYYRNYSITNENIIYNTPYYIGLNSESESSKEIVKLFTDRGIYRPGQTLYYKGIVYKENSDYKREVVKNKEITLTLYDVNNQKIAKQELTTNDFGSVSGEFILPAGGLTGQYRIQVDYYSAYFSVEEYKRPKFEVEFDKITDTFRLDEEITAKGKAIAFSGANIDNAKVNYRVSRQATYPYLPWWRRSYIVYEPEEEIAFGEAMTDNEGEFEVKFLAKPSKERKKDEIRTYKYIVNVDVTDINGETQSSSQVITVGDRSMLFSLNLADRVNLEEFNQISLNTNNLNGEFASAKGELKISKLIPPKQIYRTIGLSKGDYQLYTKGEFEQYFPHDTYKDENETQNWEKENPILVQKFDTEKSKELKLNPKNWKEGYYYVEGFILDGKDSIKVEQLLYAYKTDKKQPIDKELFSAITSKNKYEPGETAKLIFSSSTTNSTVIARIELDGKIVETKQLALNNGVAFWEIPIQEKHRGSLFVHYYFGKYNTADAGTLTINVPYENKDLSITAGTLRDKLQPGAEETWELTVSGAKKDKFMAEMLAAMYDASLDQFVPHDINFSLGKPYRYSFLRWNISRSYEVGVFYKLNYSYKNHPSSINYAFDELNWFGFDINEYEHNRRLYRSKTAEKNELIKSNYNCEDEDSDGVCDSLDNCPSSPGPMSNVGCPLTIIESEEEIRDIIIVGDTAYKETADLSTGAGYLEEKPENQSAKEDIQKDDLDNVQARKALQETAFFYPNLKTDEEGNIKIQFTVPESLTEWKFMATAHTPDLRIGNFEARVRTQKDLMVVPNAPRFLREGDEMIISSKVVNLSEKELKGNAKLMLFDAFSMQAVDVDFANSKNTKSFTAAQGNSANISWTIKVPKTHQAIVYRVVASAGDFSDGEESALPILSNRMMLTETMPIHIREGQDKTFVFSKLIDNESNTLDNFKLTFEMTTNPIWYAVFSLPYLREYPYECSEQIFSRLYGNMISQHLINSTPKIKAVFDDWNSKGQLKSKLEQNEELKSLLLEETPWIRQAENEEEQMKRIALLFDLNKMRNELNGSFQKLKNKQSSSGGFPWFEGGDDDVYITTHIVSGFGHLKAMGINYKEKFDINANSIVKGAIRYIDNDIQNDYNIYKKNNKIKPSISKGIHYLYARSFFTEDYPMDKKKQEIINYYLTEFDKDKFNQSLQTQAMLALVFKRYGKENLAKQLLTSIKDNAVESDEMGMYWKNNLSGWYWYQAPVETQSLLIEAFDEVLKDTESVESMKVWLLKNRQTNQWNSTKATTKAVYALMNTGKDWTNAEEGISIKIGEKPLDLNSFEQQKGSGYIKTSWNKEEIKPEMGKVEVQKTSPGVAWGAMYWQYFEDLDKITEAETGIRFKKELFIKKNSKKGPILTKITSNTPIKIGDLISVRLEIKIDRDMQFIHIKDMRASGFEPVNVLSSYKRQGGIGYYESTRDAATNFFVDRMPKGTYVFEYELRANNAGSFSNGITSMQNMYAPELSAHSEGIRVEIKE